MAEDSGVMKQLIKKELDQIKELEDRKILKEMLNNTFLPLYQKTQEMYEQLEQRVFAEIPYDSNNYAVACGLIKKSELDPVPSNYVPMKEESKEELFLKDYPIKVMEVLIESDYLTIMEILNTDTVFQGSVITETNTYHGEFSLKRNKDYIGEIQHLYQLFIRNGVPWKTVHHPYIYKIADVYLESIEEALEGADRIKEIQVDFKRYKEVIKYDRIPIWNVSKEKVESFGFPIPCEDHKNYEHWIYLKEEEKSCAYLINDTSGFVHGIRRTENKIRIVSEQDEIQNWDFYKIWQGDWQLWKEDYPMFGNHRKDHFMERIHYQNRSTVKTSGELIRFIESLGMEPYLELIKFEITEEQEEQQLETYFMNEFAVDEFRIPDMKTCLKISMRSKQAVTYLTRDILSYVVSEIQMLYPEYHCIGVLV